MTTAIYGLAVPHDQNTHGFLQRPGGNLRERIPRGAITQAALAAEGTQLRVNHDPARVIPGATVTLFNGRPGLYFVVRALDSAMWRDLLATRHTWNGVSICYDGQSAKEVTDWPSCTRVMAKID